jgi:hypothetical protein
MQSISELNKKNESQFSLAPHLNTNHLKEIEKKKPAKRQIMKNLRIKVRDFIDNPITIAVIGVITIYALLADDIRQLSGNKNTDIGFDIVTYIVFSIFMVEIVLSIWAKPRYLGG